MVGKTYNDEWLIQSRLEYLLSRGFENIGKPIKEAYFDPSFSDNEHKHNPTNISSYQKGEILAISSPKIDDFENNIKTFEVVKEVREINGIDANSLLVKQLDGSKTMMFYVTKNDCKTLGVDYEKGLMLMPIDMQWQRVTKDKDNKPKKKEFDKNNLSTYPLDYSTRSIKRMLVRIKGFKEVTASSTRTPIGVVCDNARLFPSFKFRCKRDLVFPSITVPSSNDIPFKFVTNIVSNNKKRFVFGDSVFVELDFGSMDGTPYGLVPNKLEGFNINDLIEFEYGIGKSTFID